MNDSSRYKFVTRWTIPADQDRVWNVLLSPDEWPTWWHGVERVELLQRGRDELGHGAIRRYTWKSRLPYRLTFVMETTAIDPPTRIEGRATGELDGLGCWHLSHDGHQTDVRYDWHVTTTKPWMQWLAPIARPLFAWNHNVVMDWGRQGLLRRLNVE